MSAAVAAVVRAWDRVSLPLSLVGAPVIFAVALYSLITGAA